MGDGAQDLVYGQGDAGAEVKRCWVGEALIFQQNAHGQVLSRFAKPGFSELASSGGLFPGEKHGSMNTFPLFGPVTGEVVGAVDPFQFGKLTTNRVFRGSQCQLIAIFRA